MLGDSGPNAGAHASTTAQRENPMSETLLSDEVFVVDDDPMVGDLLNMALGMEGYHVTSFNDGESFRAAARARVPACVILDVFMPGKSGLDILKTINAHDYPAPIIVMSGKASIAMAVEAVKNGAFDIIEKPFSLESIVGRVRDAAEAWARRRPGGIESLPTEFPGCQPLTQREAEVLAEIAAASSNKEAGRRLGISPRTVEVHRARIMMKLGAKNTADLVRIALTYRKH